MPTYEVQCGDIDGEFEAAGPGEAFRQLIARAKPPVCFGALARFRRVDAGRTLITKKWHYQNPPALEKSK